MYPHEPRILIVDDHAIVREGLRWQLKAQLKSVYLGEAASGSEALRQIRKTDWDLILLDLSLPDRSGLDVLDAIRAAAVSTPVLVLSAHPEALYGVRAIRAGAAGYLPKDAAPRELAQAVKKLLAGKRYITDSLAQCLVRELEAPVPGPLHDRLSDRELYVLQQIASGMTVSDIARDLNLSVKTVSTYRSRVLGKMGLETNAQLTHYAFTHGLVDFA